MIKLIFVFGIFCFFSCGDKEKTNQEKVIGTWKRDQIFGMGGQQLSTDTVHISDKEVRIKNVSYTYYLKENKFIYYKNNDTSSFCYEFISDIHLKWTCLTSPTGDYFNLIKI
jgi:hypothetical protein